jgi:hypothetical protein
MPLIKQIVEDFDLDEPTIFDNDNGIIDHSLMPWTLNQFEYFIDIPQSKNEKDHIIKNELSLCGLQALSCGTKVISPFNYKPIEIFPDQNDVIKVCEKLRCYLMKEFFDK